ncbi:MAG: hydroxymethylglutaryl-CoA reductase, degradative [Anaerolineales bacterium]|nr:hydroxymethylglutaryl-CoA reductase, degradative [Anaerolineales bacterium]
MLTQSNIPVGLYKLSQSERLDAITGYANLNQNDIQALNRGLTMEQADSMIENVIGRYTLPLGLGTNFLINGQEFVVPMVVEEPSIVAAVSYAAKLISAGGGFKTSSSEPLMIGQVQLLDLTDLVEATAKINAAEAELLAVANQFHPTIQKLGGGAKGIECRFLPDTPAGPMLIVHLLYDCRDAMGANAVNTAVEAIAPLLEQITSGRVNLRILSNLTDRRTARAEGLVPVDQLARPGVNGEHVAQAIFEAWAFAAADPYRAATHNKGIMNGIDAVALATGNDWRALEAGAHAYAARNGCYTSLTDWSVITLDDGNYLKGVLDMPLSVGTVGGATKAHPTARVSMKILGNPHARTLAEIMAAAGLAQNLAALRALATEGIQTGHMRLHARQVALAAGASADQVQRIADILVSENNIREERAKALIEQGFQNKTKL